MNADQLEDVRSLAVSLLHGELSVNELVHKVEKLVDDIVVDKVEATNRIAMGEINRSYQQLRDTFGMMVRGI